jgi:hypothetical protein
MIGSTSLRTPLAIGFPLKLRTILLVCSRALVGNPQARSRTTRDQESHQFASHSSYTNSVISRPDHCSIKADEYRIKYRDIERQPIQRPQWTNSEYRPSEPPYYCTVQIHLTRAITQLSRSFLHRPVACSPPTLVLQLILPTPTHFRYTAPNPSTYSTPSSMRHAPLFQIPHPGSCPASPLLDPVAALQAYRHTTKSPGYHNLCVARVAISKTHMCRSDDP